LDAIQALEEALAKQEGQSNFCPQCEALARELKAIKQEQRSDSEQLGEPAVWDGDCVLGYCGSPAGCEASMCCRADTTPQQRKPLTDEQIGDIAALYYPRWQGHEGFARAIEAAHGIKE
jgi:IS4 transposase